MAFGAGGNSYGTSWPSGVGERLDQATRDAANYQGRHLVEIAERQVRQDTETNAGFCACGLRDRTPPLTVQESLVVAHNTCVINQLELKRREEVAGQSVLWMAGVLLGPDTV